jgi:hypothetical protein
MKKVNESFEKKPESYQLPSTSVSAKNGANSKEELQTRRYIMLKVAREWAEDSSIHGIGNISKNGKLLVRILWLVCILIAVGYCAYVLSQNVIAFMEHGVNSQVSITRQSSIQFPVVTFCNKNILRANYSDVRLLTYINQLKFLYIETYLRAFTDALSVCYFFDYLKKYIPFKFNYTTEQKYALSYNIDDMLVNCRFNNIPCYASDFEHFYTTSYGNCYKFNSGRSLNGTQTQIQNSSSPGRRNALSMELFTGYPSMEFDLLPATGFQLFVHNASSTPLTEIQGISLPAGSSTDVVLSQVFINKLSEPYSNCIDSVRDANAFDSFLYKTTLRLNGIYEQEYCLQVCWQQYVINACNCSDIAAPRYDNTRPCNESEVNFCGYQHLILFYGTNLSSVCFDPCPAECNSIQYNLRVSQGNYPSLFYADLLVRFGNLYPNAMRNFSTYDQIKETVALVNVYYDDISYTVIDEVPVKTTESFVADIGGILGLCVGASFLSFVEIIELIIEQIVIFIEHRKRAKSDKVFPFKP